MGGGWFVKKSTLFAPYTHTFGHLTYDHYIGIGTSLPAPLTVLAIRVIPVRRSGRNGQGAVCGSAGEDSSVEERVRPPGLGRGDVGCGVGLDGGVGRRSGRSGWSSPHIGKLLIGIVI